MGGRVRIYPSVFHGMWLTLVEGCQPADFRPYFGPDVAVYDVELFGIYGGLLAGGSSEI